MEAPRLGPSRWYYAVAAAVFLAGCGSVAFVLIGHVERLRSSLVQIVAPGEKELNLTQPGDYTVFYEHESVVNGRAYSTGERLSGLECQLVLPGSGSAIALTAPGMSTTYLFGGRSGRSIFGFRIGRSGDYLFSCRYAGGRAGPEVVLAIGRDFGGRVFTLRAQALAVLIGSLAAAVAIAAVTAVRREKAKKQKPADVAPPE